MSRIVIPEMETTGHTPDTLFEQMMLLIESATKQLAIGHKQNDLTDAVGVFLSMGKMFIKRAYSIQTLARDERDATSCYGLLRMQADLLCVMYRIYANKDEDETKFRYLLYFLDGYSQRKKTLDCDYKYDNRCTKDEFDRIQNQVNSAVTNAQYMIETCLRLLDKHPYKLLNPSLFQKVVDKKGWKYESFSADQTTFKNQDWKELYALIDSRPTIQSFYSYFSQYVHGLSNSLLLEDEPDNFYSIKCIEIVLLEKYHELLNLLFGEKIVQDAAMPVLTELIQRYVDYYYSSEKIS